MKLRLSIVALFVSSLNASAQNAGFWVDQGDAPIIVHRMSPDGRQLLDEGLTVYTGPVAEGTKFLKRKGYYYLIIPGGWAGLADLSTCEKRLRTIRTAHRTRTRVDLGQWPSEKRILGYNQTV